MNQDTILTAVKAVGASGAIEVIQQAPTPDSTSEIIKIVSQVLIAIATIFSILRKRK